MERFIEFFSDDNNQLSMSRLLCFMCFWPSTWVLLKNPTENMMGYYLGAFIVNYVGGRFGAAWQSRGGREGPTNLTINAPDSSK